MLKGAMSFAASQRADGGPMMKSLIMLTAAASVAVALTAAPTDAFAQRYYRGGGAAIGLGILSETSAHMIQPGYAVSPGSRWQSRPVRRSTRPLWR
jgi:hypothetical protein